MREVEGMGEGRKVGVRWREELMEGEGGGL